MPSWRFGPALAGLLLALAWSAAGADVPGRRIVSLLPSVTELLCAAGARDRLVAVSEHCDYPASVRALPRVGSWKAEDARAILALRPDLVVGGCCNGVPLAEALEAAGVPVVSSDPQSLPEVIAELRRLAELAGSREGGERAARDLERVLLQVPPPRDGARPRVLVGRPRDGAYLPGPGTYVDDLIRRAGGENAVTAAGWQPHDASALGRLRADVVFVPTSAGRGEPGAVVDVAGETGSAWREWPAVTRGQVYAVPANWIHRPGPRVFRALEVVRRRVAEARVGEAPR